MEEFSLNFEGYWRDCNKNGLPNYSGVYLVYRCKYIIQTNTVSLIDIIYIGQAENIHDRHLNHEKYEDFKNMLQEGEELCFSCVSVNKGLDLVENALIFSQKPVLNEQGKYNYNFTEAHIETTGACACLKYTNFNMRYYVENLNL